MIIDLLKVHKILTSRCRTIGIGVNMTKKGCKFVRSIIVLLMISFLLAGCQSSQVIPSSSSSTPASEISQASEKPVEINVAWQYIKDSQQQVWFKYIFEPFTDRKSVV